MLHTHKYYVDTDFSMSELFLEGNLEFHIWDTQDQHGDTYWQVEILPVQFGDLTITREQLKSGLGETVINEVESDALFDFLGGANED